MWGSGIWKISVLFAQFCWDPKTALKNNVYLKSEFPCRLGSLFFFTSFSCHMK